jgi:hypothetical protein
MPINASSQTEMIPGYSNDWKKESMSLTEDAGWAAVDVKSQSRGDIEYF